MSGLKAKDLRESSVDELRTRVRSLEEELFKFKMKKTTNQLENTMLVRNTKRDIARILTIIGEKERTGGATEQPSKE